MNKHQAKPPERPIAAKSKRLTSFGNLTFEQIVTLWRVQRGGITDIVAAKKAVGTDVNGIVCKAAVAMLDRALSEPLPLANKLRCRSCGSLIVSVPCLACGRDFYRVPERT